MKRLVFPILALLVGCGTPQEQCIRTNTRDLRTVERLIAEAEGNLQRGYAYETITVYEPEWTWCRGRPPVAGQPDPPPRLCLDERPVSRTRPKAIDLNEEARKLASLRTKRDSLARQAEAVIAQCKVEYPE